jgi:hypothetical protein
LALKRASLSPILISCTTATRSTPPKIPTNTTPSTNTTHQHRTQHYAHSPTHPLQKRQFDRQNVIPPPPHAIRPPRPSSSHSRLQLHRPLAIRAHDRHRPPGHRSRRNNCFWGPYACALCGWHQLWKGRKAKDELVSGSEFCGGRAEGVFDGGAEGVSSFQSVGRKEEELGWLAHYGAMGHEILDRGRWLTIDITDRSSVSRLMRAWSLSQTRRVNPGRI